jgi:hypothetical protein
LDDGLRALAGWMAPNPRRARYVTAAAKTGATASR